MLPKRCDTNTFECDIVGRAEPKPIRTKLGQASEKKEQINTYTRRTHTHTWASVFSQICWLLILQFFYTSLAHFISHFLSIFTFCFGWPVAIAVVVFCALFHFSVNASSSNYRFIHFARELFPFSVCSMISYLEFYIHKSFRFGITVFSALSIA